MKELNNHLSEDSDGAGAAGWQAEVLKRGNLSHDV